MKGYMLLPDMGSSQSHQSVRHPDTPIFLALKELLQLKDIEIRKRNLLKFLEECDTVAPWFAMSGSLTLPSWDKLGRDLDFAHEQGDLNPGIRPIWRMIRSCLDDQKCSGALEAGRIALEQLKEERSESASSVRSTEAKADASLYSELLGREESEEEEETVEALERLALRAGKGSRSIRSRACPPVVPSAPPPPYAGGHSSSQRALHAEVWRQAAAEPSLACPVFLDQNNTPY